MGLRVKEGGESESRPVTGRIGVAPTHKGNIIPRESGQTSAGSFVTRKLKEMQKQEFVEKGVAAATGASLRKPMDWHSINWNQVHRNVRRLQSRIVKALKSGQKRKVRALQFILVRSLSARALAVKRVTTNRGKNTPGVDGEIWDTPRKKTQAVKELCSQGYRPQPLRRKVIAKRNGGQRLDDVAASDSNSDTGSVCTCIQDVFPMPLAGNPVAHRSLGQIRKGAPPG